MRTGDTFFLKHFIVNIMPTPAVCKTFQSNPFESISVVNILLQVYRIAYIRNYVMHFLFDDIKYPKIQKWCKSKHFHTTLTQNINHPRFTTLKTWTSLTKQ